MDYRIVLYLVVQKILEYIVAEDYKPIKGSNLHAELPLHKELLNQLFADLAEQKNIIKQVEIIELSKEEAQIQISIMPVKIGFKSFELVDRVITCRVLNDFSPPDFRLKLEITNGLRFWEDALIDILFDAVLNLKALNYRDKVLSISLAPENLPDVFNFIENTNLVMKKDHLLYSFDWIVKA